MKTRGTAQSIFLAALTVVSVATCGGGDSAPFASPENDYMIEFPGGEPESQQQQIPMPNGDPLPMTIYMSEDGDRGYATGRVEMPAASEDVKGTLEASRDGAVRNVNGELIDSKPVTLQGREGIEYSARVTSGGVEGMLVARNYVDDSVLYQVIVVGPGEVGATDEDVASFFESFTFQDA